MPRCASQQNRLLISEMGQNPNLPRRSIAVRFTLNKQTPKGGVQYDAMCHSTKSLRDRLLPDGLSIYPQGEIVG
jgi:hypothetical protein